MGSSLAPGIVIENRYVVQRFIAQGGIAHIYAASHRVTGREVALKIPTPDRIGDRTVSERLNREAVALARARHPGVVEILDAGDYDGQPYLVLERMEGRTLGGLLAARGKFQWAEAARIGLRLAEILAHCHRVGVIHRDLKPDNIFIELGPTGGVKLFDFGIARLASDTDDELRNKLTQEGAIVGTPEYMAPEALLMQPIMDHRVDVYAFGVVLYELLTGVVPFEGSYADVLVQVSTKPTPNLADGRPDVPAALRDAIGRCLAKDQNERFASLDEIAAALSPIVGPEREFRVAAPEPTKNVASPAAQKSTIADTPAARRTPQGQAAGTREARRFPRAPYTTPAVVTLGGGEVLDGRIEEISEGGVQFIASRGVTSGQIGDFRFGLPIGGKVCQVKGTARWTKAARANRHVTGFEFQGLGDEAATLIRQYVTLMGGA